MEHTETPPTETLLVIDGHSMAFRAFYALPADTFLTTTGQHTNAVYGFVTMLLRLLEEERPTRIAVAFDVSRHSFRTEEYPEYKGTRAETPPEFAGQVELIGEVLDAMGIRRLTKDGYEADDILATLAHEGGARGWDVLVASGDRDAFQTVTDRVTVLYPGQGPNDLRRMTPAAIEEKYGVPPSQYPEIAALVGETADNLPGVPGVGPKTAAQWLVRFGGLESLLARADEVGGKRGQALRDALDEVRRNRRLNRLLTDLDVGVDVDDLRRGPTDRRAVEDLFDVLEFTALRRRVVADAGIGVAPEVGPDGAPAGSAEAGGAHEGGEPGDPASADLRIAVCGADTDLAAWTASAAGPVGLWVEGPRRPGAGDAQRVALAGGGRALVIETEDLTPDQDAALGAFLADCERFVVHDGKGAWHALRGRGWSLRAPEFDVQLAAYLIRPEQRDYDLETLAQRYLGRTLTTASGDAALFDLEDVAAEPGRPSAAQVRAGEAAQACADLRTALVPVLDEHEESHLMGDIELPLQGVLARMEDTGIAVDPEVFDALHGELAAGVDRAAAEAYRVIGHEVNLSSPKQLQEVLFEELELPYTKRTKTGYTTNAEALQELWVRTHHEFLTHLLAHRDRIKLLQMVETLQTTIAPDQRIRTTFSQVVAATGRLASSDPNLQNIPARTADGRRIRHGFVAGPGYASLMSADYSQIEMRIMAHLSRDAGLIEAFNSGEDLHQTMASMIFGTPVDQVTGEQRTRIKATSYGLAYGLSSYGLSQQLGIPVPEAAELRERYFERFGGVRDYLEGLVAQARRDGYTQTMFHRRRYLPDLRSENRQRREMAERAALNAPIQGSAADIIKIAMVRVRRALDEAGLASRLLLQIHDELIVEVAPGEEADVARIVTEGMASPVRMDVPLDIAIGVGHSWMDAAH